MLEFIKSVFSLLNQKEIKYLIVESAAQLLFEKNVIPSDLDIWVRYRNHNMNKFEEFLKIMNWFQNSNQV